MSLKGHRFCYFGILEIWQRIKLLNVVTSTHPTTCGHCRMEQEWCKGQHRHLQWRSFLGAVWGPVSGPSSLFSKSADQALYLHSGTPCGKPWFLEHTRMLGLNYETFLGKIQTILRPNGLKLVTTGRGKKTEIPSVLIIYYSFQKWQTNV